MNNEATLEKMVRLKLFGMKHSFENMLDTGSIHDMKNDEMIAHLLEVEYDERYNKRIRTLIKNAGFRMTSYIEEIRYDASRNLKKSEVLNLSELNWLSIGENVMISGSTGTGKSFLSCALGMKACMNHYKVRYFNFNKLIGQIKYEKSCNNYKSVEKLSKVELLIIDDFGFDKLDKDSRIIFFELLEERYERKSVIIASQVPMENWYEIIGDKTIADAIMDRLISNSHQIKLGGDTMRKIKTKKS
jgi:DNA replication protein DnaC